MRTPLSWACGTVAALLAACAAVKNQPAPPPTVLEPRVVFHGFFDADAQGLLGTQGITSLFRFKGHATIEYRPAGPTTFLYFDGAADFTITPTPGLEAEAIRAIDTRAVVVIRDGINVGLRAPLPPMPAPPQPAKPPPPPDPPLACGPDGEGCDVPFVH